MAASNNQSIVTILVMCMLSWHAHALFSEERVIDTIVSVVSSPAGTEIITQSDLDRPTLFGHYRTQEECELEKAILLEAKKHHISVDEAMIEAYLESIQQAYNMTRADIQAMFHDAGYSEQEAREQLRTSQITNIILQREIYENISVSFQDAQAYYDDNPEYEAPSYTLQRAVIILSPEESIEEIIREGKQLQFSDPITLYQAEISEDHQFITLMIPGEMQPIQTGENTYEVIKLLEKREARLKTLEERSSEIMHELQKKQYETLFEQCKKRMLNSVSIVRL